jgi:predicted outer membrane repeat protein
MNECASMVYGCSFLNNVALDRGGGVFCDGILEAPTFSHCTFAYNSAASGAAVWLHLAWELGTFANTIIAFSGGGEVIYLPGSLFVPRMKCCDLYGNAGGDWTGYLKELDGVEGNFSEDPLFCVCSTDKRTSPYALNADSPCMYGNHPYGYACGGLIGAHGVGCGMGTSGQHPMTRLAIEQISSEAVTWGRIKARYRD